MSRYVRLSPAGAVRGEIEAVGLAVAYREFRCRAGEFVRQADANGEQRARREYPSRCWRCKRYAPKGDEFSHVRCHWRRAS